MQNCNEPSTHRITSRFQTSTDLQTDDTEISAIKQSRRSCVSDFRVCGSPGQIPVCAHLIIHIDTETAIELCDNAVVADFAVCSIRVVAPRYVAVVD